MPQDATNNKLFGLISMEYFIGLILLLGGGYASFQVLANDVEKNTDDIQGIQEAVEESNERQQAMATQQAVMLVKQQEMEQDVEEVKQDVKEVLRLLQNRVSEE